MASDTRNLIDRLALGPASAADLSQSLGVSQPTISRALRRLERSGQVLRIMGSTRGARYGVPRSIDQIGSRWPLYRIDETGAVQELGHVNAIERDHYFVSDGPPRIRGLFEGLPYYLQDLRPAGFLGRTIPRAYPELELPLRVADWTDAHVLAYLARCGTECTGDLIVGTEALDRYLATANAPAPIDEGTRSRTYPQLANAAMEGRAGGSSAHGEQPKFTACVASADLRTHVLVKFSPPRNGPLGARWADLLIAEHLAHETLTAEGILACRSEILEAGERIFLETKRFDRIGAEGRRGAVSLFAVDTARYGRLDDWTSSAERLRADGLLSREDAEHIRLIDAFGALIGNTDRHFGNITLFDSYVGYLQLAPVYDMLPMLFAPADEQLIQRVFEPAPPTAAWLSIWPRAYAIAERYWNNVAQDARITAAFREQSARCLESLRALPARGRLRSA